MTFRKSCDLMTRAASLTKMLTTFYTVRCGCYCFFCHLPTYLACNSYLCSLTYRQQSVYLHKLVDKVVVWQLLESSRRNCDNSSTQRTVHFISRILILAICL